MLADIRHELIQLYAELAGQEPDLEVLAFIEQLAATVATGVASMSEARHSLVRRFGLQRPSAVSERFDIGGAVPHQERRTKRGGTHRRGPIRRSPPKPEPAAAGTPQSADRVVYPELTAPSVVVAEQEFELRAGLSPTPNSDVVGDAFHLPPHLPDEYAVVIQIVATGFTPRADESLRQVLSVSRDNPYPTVTLHLTAAPQAKKVLARSIQAIYSVGAQTIGMAVRAISVVKTAALLDEAPAPAQEPNRDFALPVSVSAPDMTVRLVRDRERPGGLNWSIETRFADVHVPARALESDIGTDPDKFARRVMNGVNARQGKPPQLESYLRGVAKTIGSQHMPAEFWRIFSDVAARCGGPPTILLLSEEPYVPWELAHVDVTLPDPNAPPYLSAQAVIGRWPLGTAKLPPPEEVNVQAVAVVSGVYGKPGWQRLQAAEDEAATLVAQRFGSTVAHAIEAASAPIIDCLRGIPPADLLHFAVHGTFDPNGNADGIVLVDGSTLDALEVRGSTLDRRPFVFLNACQVGQGNTMLGDYSGIAEAFLSAGASAVIAPLWSIKDTLARDAALGFYAGEVTRPAHSMRDARAQAGNALPQLTLRLAYQFFGHPSLKLRLPAQPPQG